MTLYETLVAQAAQYKDDASKLLDVAKTAQDEAAQKIASSQRLLHIVDTLDICTLSEEMPE